jgi:type II secretory pathway component GspD/PulD (secretin)
METKSFVLQYAEVEDLNESIASLLTQGLGSIRVDHRTKTLIVSDVPHVLARVEQLVDAFDIRSKQVFIEAKIVQVKLDREHRLGVNWDDLFRGLDPRFNLHSVFSPGSAASFGSAKVPTVSMNYNTIAAGSDLTVVLDALEEVGDTKIMANPHVAALDGVEATTKVITDQPYAEAKLESGSTNIVGETIIFLEVGVTLSVTPRVNDEGMIVMSIKPEVSAVVGEYQAFRTVPIVRKSVAQTTVMIKDGETIIIASMIDNRTVERERKVPFLGSIPVLGWLFRSTAKAQENNELIVFLTPRIISGEEPFLRMNDMKKKPKPMRPVGGGVKKARPIR